MTRYTVHKLIIGWYPSKISELHLDILGRVRYLRTTPVARWPRCPPSRVPPTAACHMTPPPPGRPTSHPSCSPDCKWQNIVSSSKIHVGVYKFQCNHSSFVTMIAGTYVTTALGFFSTAYTFLIFRSAWWEAAIEALTRGPLPAPTTIKTLQQITHLLSNWYFQQEMTINSMIAQTNTWQYEHVITYTLFVSFSSGLILPKRA